MSLASSLVSSSARRLPWRMRPDLTARRHRYQGQSYWVVKEPVGLHYFRFQEEEFAILQMLDGKVSLDDLKEQFEDRFPPQKITVEEISQFVGTLHRSNLLISDAPGQGVQLRKRGDERRWQEFVQKFSNVLAIRFKGIDPERLLNWLYPKVRWFFTPTAVALSCVFGLSALLLVLVQFDVFMSKLPGFHEFFQAKNWFWLGVALVVSKILHEFGHGLACKHFGGECHEMGVLLLVLTPCLYCNVSDSWMLPNKWSRAAIGAAGMYVELVIASIATYLWWFSAPGYFLNQMCLSTMFVCSVSTIMFNANPLLRYDGYYILSDLSEIPNLRQKATTILSRTLGSVCLGLEQPDDPFLPQRNRFFFGLYAVAATVYSWVVALSILWFLNAVFKPYNLQVIGQFIALFTLYGLLIQPLWKLGKYMTVPGRIHAVKRPRLLATVATVAVAVAAVLAIPLPYRVYCSLEVRPRDAAPVYVNVPGQLQEVLVRQGQVVSAGARLAQLRSLDVELSIADLEGKRDQLAARLEGLGFERSFSRDATQEVAQVRESLTAAEKQLAERLRDRERLTLVAPVAGTVLPPPATQEQAHEDGRLSGWSGTPMDEKNRGAVLAQSTLFCQIGNPEQWEAVLVIDQADVSFIRHKQSVSIKLDQLPSETFTTEIVEVAQGDLKVAPSGLSAKAGGELATRTDSSGVERPVSASYEARAPLDDPRRLLLTGLRGQAKVKAGYQTVGQRLWRWLSQTFNFKL